MMAKSRRKLRPVRVYRWHFAVLKLLDEQGAMTAEAIGIKLYRHYARDPSISERVASFECNQLRRMDLATLHAGRWNLTLLGTMQARGIESLAQARHAIARGTLIPKARREKQSALPGHRQIENVNGTLF